MFREGGIYLDMDEVTLKSFAELRRGKYQVVLGREIGGMFESSFKDDFPTACTALN